MVEAVWALLVPGRSWVGTVGVVMAMVLGLGSIWAMPLQTDLDGLSLVVLSLTHVMVTAAAVLALLPLRSTPRSPERALPLPA